MDAMFKKNSKRYTTKVRGVHTEDLVLGSIRALNMIQEEEEEDIQIKKNQRFHRADSRIRLQWCLEITVDECVKIAKY